MTLVLRCDQNLGQAVIGYIFNSNVDRASHLEGAKSFFIVALERIIPLLWKRQTQPRRVFEHSQPVSMEVDPKLHNFIVAVAVQI